MEAKDWIATVLSVVTLIGAIIGYYRNKATSDAASKLAEQADGHATIANTLAVEANAIAKLSERRLSVEAEVAVLRLINEARLRVNDLFTRILEVQKGKEDTDLTAPQKLHIKRLSTSYEEAVEIMLNSYELGCGMYLDDKIDRERFKRQYSKDLNRFVESDNQIYRKRLHVLNTDFRALMKVWDEWHNLEKDRK